MGANPQAVADGEATEAGFRVAAWPPWWRAVAAVAFGLSRASLPLMLLVLLRARTPILPATMLRAFALLFALPGAAAWLVGRALAARVRIGDDAVIVDGRAVSVEIAPAAIAGVAPWRLPLPAAGVALVLATGRRLRYAIAAADPTPLLRALAAHGVAGAEAAAGHPAVVYARARAAYGRWRWPHLVARFPLFALLPTAPLFNVHQHIAYGGLFGEYYIYGPRAWWGTLALYWAIVTIYLVLYAAVWRGLAEPICLFAAAVAPSRAARVRRAAELAIRVLYYGGVPVLLVLRFAPW